MKNNLVSIVMPAYNAEHFIGTAIQSIQAQTYSNWELLIVDDCSKDQTVVIVQSYAEKDSRIKCIPMKKNSGAAAARNAALSEAQGEYIAFLDSDDLWYEQKLEKQLKFMQSKDSVMCATAYEVAQGTEVKQIISYKKAEMDYQDLLKTCPGNSTMILHREKLNHIEVPLIKKRNDYILWLKLIKQCRKIDFYPEVLTRYYLREESISNNKVSLVKYHWQIYFHQEKLGMILSAYYTIYWMSKGIRRKLQSLGN